jgi:HEAT repeats
MSKLAARRSMWVGVSLLAIAVLSVSAYLLTRKQPGPPQAPADPYARFDLRSEQERAMALPEFAELKKLNSKENRPLSPAAIARMGELAGHANFWIRLNAVGFLGNAPDALHTDAAELVVPRLKDEVPWVRLSAMDALGRLEAKDRIPDLLAIMNSEDQDERKSAKRALQRLGHPIE